MIITLELTSTNMTNNGGRYTQYIDDLPFGRRVKIKNIISVTGMTTALISATPFLFWNSNIIQNNSFDSFTNSNSNTLQVINHTTRVVYAPLTYYNTDTLNSPFETVIPQTISIEKRIGITRTLLVDDVPFYIKIIMETIDENK